MDSTLPPVSIQSAVKPTSNHEVNHIPGQEQDEQCFLEYLLQQNDLSTLEIVLEAAIWQRFSLLPDVEMFPEEGPHCNKSEHQVTESPADTLFDISLGRRECCDLNVEGLPIIPYDRSQIASRQKLSCLKCCQLKGRCQDDPPYDVNLLSPWLVLSAVFTGCPKLLHHLLVLGETSEASTSQQSQGEDDECIIVSSQTRDDECILVSSDSDEDNPAVVTVSSDSDEDKLSGVRDVHQTERQRRTTQQPPPSSAVCLSGNTDCCLRLLTKHTNQSSQPKVTSSGLTTESSLCSKRQLLTPDSLAANVATTNQVVRARMPCEFPITDTWIHQSVNLMISPLHLACWRHDYVAICLLLQHGADPNELALEEVLDKPKTKPRTHKKSLSGKKENKYVVYNGFWFHPDKGLSPLHFIALGIRSPPRHALLDGCKVGIVHDIPAFFWDWRKSETFADRNLAWFAEEPTKEYTQIPCVKVASPGQGYLDEHVANIVQSELVTRCLELLLQAGANANTGQNLILKGAYPLDIILQPPPKVYYAPSVEHNDQSSVALRLQDLEYRASQVVAACDMLHTYDAEVSSHFFSMFRWRPELLDCFHLREASCSYQLVGHLIRLGMFSDDCDIVCSANDKDSSCSFKMITLALTHRFIAEVINTSVSENLISLILSWCSLSVLHCVIRTAPKIAAVCGWNDRLQGLSKIAIDHQMRSLKHCCFLVILSRVRYRYSSIWTLPIPPRLKRELVSLAP